MHINLSYTAYLLASCVLMSAAEAADRTAISFM